ncbi:MAG: hypothetical protein ACI8QD_001762, partial [Cyclobacteriaceae bacterium]
VIRIGSRNLVCVVRQGRMFPTSNVGVWVTRADSKIELNYAVAFLLLEDIARL